MDAVDSVDGRTMLHSAVLAGDVEAVRFLVENGAGRCRCGTLQHRDADVRGRLEAELGVQQRSLWRWRMLCRYLTDGVATTGTTAAAGVAVKRSGGDATKNCSNNSNGGEDLLCWLRSLPKVEPPLGHTDEHVQHSRDVV